MARGKPLTVVNMVSLNGKDGDYRPLEELTPEELQLFRAKVSERMSECLSNYYSNNPDEFEKLIKSERKDTA